MYIFLTVTKIAFVSELHSSRFFWTAGLPKEYIYFIITLYSHGNHMAIADFKQCCQTGDFLIQITTTIFEKKNATL